MNEYKVRDRIAKYGFIPRADNTALQAFLASQGKPFSKWLRHIVGWYLEHQGVRDPDLTGVYRENGNEFDLPVSPNVTFIVQGDGHVFDCPTEAEVRKQSQRDIRWQLLEDVANESEF